MTSGDKENQRGDLFSAVEDETLKKLGERIRSLRLRNEMTLSRLSQRTGLSVSMLSMVERGGVNPSIGTLVAIASALGVSLSNLFEESGEIEPRIVVSRVEQKVFKARPGVTRRILVYDPKFDVEIAENHYEPGTSSSDVPTKHRGREYGVVLEGCLELTVGNEVYRLTEGDAVCIDSTVPHQFRNVGQSNARTIWFNIYQLSRIG